MNDTTLSLTPDDPRLTAFALGELEGDERAQVAAAIAANPALQSVVDEIRATAAQLESVLAAEPAAAAAPAEPALSARKAAILPGGDPRKHDGGPLAPRGFLGEVIPFRRYAYIAGGLAAAGLAVMVGLREPPPGTPGAELRRAAEDNKVLRQAAADSITAEAKQKAEAAAAAQKARIEPAAAAPTEATTLSFSLPPPTPVAPAPGDSRNFSAGAPSTGTYVVESTDFGRGPNSTLFGGATASGGLPGVSSVQTSRARINEPNQGSDGQTAPAAPAASQPAGEVVRMVPFEITADNSSSFQSSSTGSLSRQQVNRQDTPQSYSIINRQFIDALSITDLNEAAAWSTGQSSLVTDNGSMSNTGGRGGGGRGPTGTLAPYPPLSPSAGNESYGLRRNNTFVPVASAPLSTFSIDVDTAAYANVRRFLQNGQLPPVEAVRVEEMVNYFPYRYPAPEAARNFFGRADEPTAPFAASLEVATAPWDSAVRLVRVGLKGREVSAAARPRANLVFLLDVSGSMAQPNKLPLVKESMRLLLRRLREDDRVAIVVYAGASGVALPSTTAANAGAIEQAIERLVASGSTNGASGINLAYQIATENFVRDGINRVILCTDGDFNVGVTSQGDLVRLIEERAKSNVFLTVLGYGMGNLKDSTLELLADKGNGNYGYIDTRAEAEKLLVDQVSGTLVTIAKDVKIQVEFNPAQVASYRLVGYENRLLAAEDFNNDRIDAGEIGAGHTMTALYEVVPAAGANVFAAAAAPAVDELRYQPAAAARSAAAPADLAAELLTVKVRYKEPTGDVSRKLEFPLRDRGTAFREASPDFKFAAAVAGFGLALRETRPNVQVMNAAIEWAESGLRDDPMGYRTEFVGLVRRAVQLVNSGAGR